MLLDLMSYTTSEAKWPTFLKVGQGQGQLIQYYGGIMSARGSRVSKRRQIAMMVPKVAQ